MQRAYSVGSPPAPDPSVIDLGVREVPGGMLSLLLVELRAGGQRLEVHGPYGRFTWNGQDAGPVLLVFPAITYGHAFYRDELADLAGRYRWLGLVHCITRDLTERRALYHRRVDTAILAETLGAVKPAEAYLCGSPAMVETVTTALVDLGVDPRAIATEKYD